MIAAADVPSLHGAAADAAAAVAGDRVDEDEHLGMIAGRGLLVADLSWAVTC